MRKVGKLILTLFIISILGIILYFGVETLIEVFAIIVFLVIYIVALIVSNSIDINSMDRDVLMRNPRSIYYELLRLYKAVWKRRYNAGRVPNKVYKKMRRDARNIAYSMDQFQIASELGRLRGELRDLKKQ